MKKWTLGLVAGLGFLWLLLPRLYSTAEKAPPLDKEVQTAREISQKLMAKLKGMLTQELQAGGLEGAVEACSRLAQEVQTQFSQATGHSVRRTSLRYRNPASKPDPLEEEILKQFDHQNQQGQLPPEVYRVTWEGKVRYLRYFKPVVTSSFCLTCHGSSQDIPDAIQTILKKSYRFDKATGYREGDVRGAVSVKIALP